MKIDYFRLGDWWEVTFGLDNGLATSHVIIAGQI